MVIDIGIVKNHIKPKADSTLRNMRKDNLIEYIRTLEHNYNVAVSFNENQAKYIESLTVQQWIPVTERKPDLELVEVKNQDMDLFPCLVSKVSQGQCRKTVVTKAWWDGLHFMDSDCIYITKYVTHWMPLPSVEGLK